MEAQLQARNAENIINNTDNMRGVLFLTGKQYPFLFIYTNYYMDIKQYIQNSDQRLRLFYWKWATKEPEKLQVYDKILENFLSMPEVKRLHSNDEIYFFWHLYCGALEDYTLNCKNEKLNDIIKKCPLSKKELKILFGV